ncbi:hypothetical protein M422DRAFT_56711 [Sphaerobolus stellatus SS14]|uniref:Uncharacterized protein n=1 Tax=Sphaerobolus stellatus (strain SS14) TaxID=990650 RepID=A0A0C9UE51_SPHS4|nr:hypothetical protein M422DRAFT_56711 [Sphaerobolus stellatus SS14]
MTFALCPFSREGGKGRPSKPNWNKMWVQGMDTYVDPQVLPPSPFVFDKPERLKYEDLKTLGVWLLKAEMGELTPEQCFRWKGQQMGAAISVKSLAFGRSGMTAEKPEVAEAVRVAADTLILGSDNDGKRPLERPSLPSKKKKGSAVIVASNKNEPSAEVSSIVQEEKLQPRKISGRKRTRTAMEKIGEDMVPPPPKQARGRPRMQKAEESDTEEDNPSEALVVNGHPSQTFDGDMVKGLVEGPMGSPVPLSARFIEAMEGGQLDIAMPEDSPEIGGIIDDILIPSNPLPNPSILQMCGTKKSEQVFNSLHKWAGEALLAITTFPTDLKLSVLRVGGNLGLFPGLRAVEFLRRYVRNVDKDPTRLSQVDSLLQQYDATLAQEAWWRWAIMSFAQSKHTHSGLLYEAWLLWMETVMQGNVSADDWFYMQWRNGSRPKIIDDISHITLRRVRPIQTDDFGQGTTTGYSERQAPQVKRKKASQDPLLLLDASNPSAMVPTEDVIHVARKLRSKAHPEIAEPSLGTDAEVNNGNTLSGNVYVFLLDVGNLVTEFGCTTR